jgi:uncharacterized membrane protein YkvI
MAIATVLWSLICVLTFSYACSQRLLDYRAFFGRLLGRFWFLFEITYLLLVVLMLSVFGATTGALGQALFGWPLLAGSVLLLVSIAVLVAIGAMERVRHAVTSRTGREPGFAARTGATLAVLTLCVFAAQGIGLVDLIAKGYRFISWMLIAIFILPIFAVSLGGRLRPFRPLRSPPG